MRSIKNPPLGGSIMKHKRSLMSIAMATIVLVSLCAVWASPLSVYAANGSSTQSQASGAPVGAGSGAAPAVCWEGADNFDVFVKGADGALWLKHFNGTVSTEWRSLGGVLTSDPSATSFTQVGINIHVFVRGNDSALWSRNTTNGGDTWGGWYKIGGQLLAGTGPTAYDWGAARIGWFVTGMNHALWHQWSDSAGIHSWENLGGYLTSSPAAAAIPFQIVFARGADGALWGKEYFNGWQSWYSLGGQIAPGTGPAVCAIGGHADVFVKGVGGALWHTSKYYGGGSWSAWNSPGGYLTSSPAAATTNIGTIDVLVRGGNGDLWWGNYFAFLWSGWTDVGSTP